MIRAFRASSSSICCACSSMATQVARPRAAASRAMAPIGSCGSVFTYRVAPPAAKRPCSAQPVRYTRGVILLSPTALDLPLALSPEHAQERQRHEIINRPQGVLWFVVSVDISDRLIVPIGAALEPHAMFDLAYLDGEIAADTAELVGHPLRFRGPRDVDRMRAPRPQANLNQRDHVITSPSLSPSSSTVGGIAGGKPLRLG